jgi:hypothetical protein
MPPEPVPADPGWDEDPARRTAAPDPMSAQDDPFEEEEWLDPADELTAEELAELREAAGRSAFGSGTTLDEMPGGPELALFADAAAGADDGFTGASDDELMRVLGAWGRLEAHAAGRKLAAVAELIRRRPEPGCAPEGPARMPAACDEFTTGELAQALAESRCSAEAIAWATALLDPAEA